MLKKAWIGYFVLAAAMVGTSLWTGRRASRIAGAPHYLLTATSVRVERAVEAEDEADAEFDALFEEAGEPVRMIVDEPVFVLGFLDATGPVVAGGSGALAVATIVRRRWARAGRRGVGAGVNVE